MTTRLRNVGRNKSEGPDYERFESRVMFVIFVSTRLEFGSDISRLKFWNSNM